MDKLKEFLKSNKFKAGVAICGAILMYFMPDHIDRIIETLLAAFGISVLAINEKKEKN